MYNDKLSDPTSIVAVSKPILETFTEKGGFWFTVNENSPSKLATAPVVESKTIFAPGIGLLSSSTTVPETLVCAKMKVLINTAIRDKILFMI